MKRIALVFTAVAFAALLVLPAIAETKPSDTGKTEATQKTAAAKTVQLDINSASVAQLKELPGIGEAYSKKIADGRPYARKDQLVSRGILPKNVYEKIKDLIIAKQQK